LRELDGSDRDTIVVGHVAEALEDPPPELIRDHEGSTGPLLSTIHAIKGREDKRVMLLLTRAPNGDDVDWGEEERTLYVGATRASTELRTGWVKPAKFFTKGEPRRYWSARADHRLIEIGLDGDLVSWQDFLRAGHISDQREVIAAIWRVAFEGSRVGAIRDSKGNMILQEAGEDSPSLGHLSTAFIEMMQSIRQVAADAPLPDHIFDITIVGATTVSIPGHAGAAPTLALMPLLGGFAQIPREHQILEGMDDRRA